MKSEEVNNFEFDILHVIESFSAGSREIVRLLANEQISSGLSVAVLHGVIEGTPCPVNEGFDPRVELFEIQGFSQRNAVSFVSALFEMLKFRKNRRWRYTHLHSSIAGAIGRVAFFRKPHIVYTPHGCVFMHTEKASIKLILACQLERIFTWFSKATNVACSRSEYDILVQSLGKAKVVLIPNGIEVANGNLKSEIKPDNSPLQVVALGRISNEKNYKDLVLLKRSNYERYRVTVIGGGDAQQEEKLTVEGIEVTGWLSHDHALQRLALADVLLHPSLREGMPLSILEAFARRVLVVARDSPGNRDLVENDLNGYLYQSSSQLIFLMEEISKSSFNSDAITRRAHSLIESDYSAGVMYRKYLEEYSSAS